MPFSPEYIRLVLNEQFEDAKTLVLDWLLEIHEAHLVMLAEQAIVARPVAGRLRDALAALDLEAIRQTAYTGTEEDLFFHVDRRIAQLCGDDIAGRLHTARSRNDIDMTVYRLMLRDRLRRAADAALASRRALLAQAGRHRTTVFPAHTHTQPAQPTTLAHYLLAVIEQLERDHARLASAYATVNRCPLGACAITGTGFPIDRGRTSDLLGFAGPTGNTYGSIATVDYLLESASALATTAIGIGRVAQDLLFWATAEVGYLRLCDALVQTSSIMPQKRNPVALEHVRALASKAAAQLSSLAVVLHNTPFGDIVDSEDDVQPLVEAGCQDALRALTLFGVVLDGAAFDADRMRSRAGEAGVTITELADTLTRDHGLPFRASHAIAARFARDLTSPPGSRAARIEEFARDLGHDLSISEADVVRALDPDHFVTVRQTLGGPSPIVVDAALAAASARLGDDAGAIDGWREQVRTATALRRAALGEL